MASICLASCADFELSPIPDGDCEIKFKKRSIKRLWFWLCTVAIPEPLTCQALEPLLSDASIVRTSPLANVELADPTLESIQVADCLPSLQVVTTRQLTADDRIAIVVPGDSGVLPDENGEYPFYYSLQKAGPNLRVAFEYCDGMVEIPLGADGTPMPVSATFFRQFARQGTGDGSFLIEIDRLTLTFQGDPLSYNPLIVDLSSCSALEG